MDTLLGVGEWSNRQAYPGEPGSRDYEFWLVQAQEVGLNLGGGTVDMHAVETQRSRIMGIAGMADPGALVWTWEHARAARLVTALLQAGKDITNLDERGSTFLTAAVRATGIPTGLVSGSEAATLTELAPKIDLYTEEVLEFHRMDQELTDMDR